MFSFGILAVVVVVGAAVLGLAQACATADTGVREWRYVLGASVSTAALTLAMLFLIGFWHGIPPAHQNVAWAAVVLSAGTTATVFEIGNWRRRSTALGNTPLFQPAEIALRTGFTEMGPAIGALKRGQEILGDLHDRQVLADSLDPYAKRADVEEEHVRLTRKVLEGEVLNLHSAYLCRRESLRDACADIERVASRIPYTRSTVGIGAALAVSGLVCAKALSAMRERAS